MKKSIISLLLAFAIIICICGCAVAGNRQSAPEPEATGSPGISVEPSSEAPEEPSSEPEIKTTDFSVTAGDTIEDVAQQLEEAGLCPAEEFLTECKKTPDIDLFAGYEPSDIRPYPVEGYIFSGDYEIEEGASAEDILAVFMDNAQSVITDERMQKAGAMGYTIDQMVTLASIVQKESKTVDAMPGVSAVFHCRLKSPDYPNLQSDMTRSYNGGTHNTYEVRGLPAGAICCISVEALDAALEPLDIEAYYFVYDTERNYYYAKTYSEHKKNIKKLQDEGIFDIW
ncbi:MAG: endolytic transglycosylase MltG [Clostridia bacterium]|nr:endolytic transglycosylase MltG [Clostridia bacterium]